MGNTKTVFMGISRTVYMGNTKNCLHYGNFKNGLHGKTQILLSRKIKELQSDGEGKE